MKCTQFEIEVFEKMLDEKFPAGNVKQIISEAAISNYEFTGAGYLLELTHDGINLENELIYIPVIKGHHGSLCVGFTLFTEKNTITMDCYSWDLSRLPENFRELPVALTMEIPAAELAE